MSVRPPPAIIELPHLSRAEFDAPVPSPFARRAASPMLVRGLVDDWKALTRWDMEFFRSQHGNARLVYQYRLPENGFTFDLPRTSHERIGTMREFFDEMLDGRLPCQVTQASMQLFPGTEGDHDFARLVPRELIRSTNLWLGSAATHSGLHFDYNDNLLVQIVGRKVVYLCPPTDAPHLYPLPYNASKGLVDPASVDLERFPHYANASVSRVILSPGDTIFLPRLWWHAVVALDPAISINCWFGDLPPLTDFLHMIAANGAWNGVATTAWQFAWEGVLGRRPQIPAFVGVGSSNGVILYKHLCAVLGGRSRWSVLTDPDIREA